MSWARLLVDCPTRSLGLPLDSKGAQAAVQTSAIDCGPSSSILARKFSLKDFRESVSSCDSEVFVRLYSRFCWDPSCSSEGACIRYASMSRRHSRVSAEEVIIEVRGSVNGAYPENTSDASIATTERLMDFLGLDVIVS